MENLVAPSVTYFREQRSSLFKQENRILFLVWICLTAAPSIHWLLWYLFPCSEESSIMKFLFIL